MVTECRPRCVGSKRDNVSSILRVIGITMSLIEFSYNKSYHSSICMAPFEALCGRRCRYHIGWFEMRKISLIGPIGWLG